MIGIGATNSHQFDLLRSARLCLHSFASGIVCIRLIVKPSTCIIAMAESTSSAVAQKNMSPRLPFHEHGRLKSVKNSSQSPMKRQAPVFFTMIVKRLGLLIHQPRSLGDILNESMSYQVPRKRSRIST